jgi:hypothetical protein
MFEQSAHTMELERTYPSGAEEWCCPACGRRFIMQWPPQYKRIVLEPGDEYAPHSGGKGGVQIGAMQMAPADDILPSTEPPRDDRMQDADDTAADDTPDLEALGPWLKWLKDADLDGAA